VNLSISSRNGEILANVTWSDTRLHITSTSKVTIRDAYVMSGRTVMKLVSSHTMASIKEMIVKTIRIKKMTRMIRTIKIKMMTRLTQIKPMTTRMIRTKMMAIKKRTSKVKAVRMTTAKTKNRMTVARRTMTRTMATKTKTKIVAIRKGMTLKTIKTM